jgi:hypothetical protein
MKHTLLAWAAYALFATFATTATAQTGTYPLPYQIGDAYPIATIPLSATIVDASTGKSGGVLWTVMVWGRTSGGVEYSLDAGEVAFTGDIAPIEATTTPELFDLICARSVRAGIDAGYASCSALADATGVTLATCVSRDATGCDVAGSGIYRRTYSYTCTTLALTGALGASECTSGEATWWGSVLR